MTPEATGRPICDGHRHLGVLPAYPFYGGPPVHPDIGARATVAQLLHDLDQEGTERALVLPNYGVPDPDVAFGFNELLEAADTAPGLDAIFAVARRHGLVVHVHTSPGGGSDIDRVGELVQRYGDDTPIHLVHLGGGASGHIKLVGGRFFDWIEAGKQVYTDASWSVGFAARWLVAEIERRGVGHDRLVFASDEPWSDRAGEYARVRAAAGDGELAEHVFSRTFEHLYG